MKTTLILMAISITASLICFAQSSPSTSNVTAPLPSNNSAVKYFPASEVTAAFAKGGTLAEAANYKVMTARRTESGNVEIHKKLTDVFYIVQGSTTLVTGGKVIGETATNPDEPRGTSIDGGETRQLSAGDVVVIPAGIPHWMKDVKGTLLYFVVKMPGTNE
jgi:mannose-6-phosphate isomerase-like protein (cupin superfamily)